MQTSDFSPTATTGSGKIVFANQLRGLAALCVVFIHYTVVYQYMRPLLSWVIAAPPIDGPIPAFVTSVYSWWLDLGAFGVALFFLISGFVIPFSLEKNTTSIFLIARALRIFPTYWAALLIEWSIIHIASRHWGRPIVFTRQTFLDNLLLLHTSIGDLGVDFVNWTLAVEIKFYLLMALLRPLILRKRIWPLLLYPVAALLLNTAQGNGLIHLPAQLVAESMFVAFILPGTLFYYRAAGSIRTRTLLLGCVAIVALATACWRFGPNPGEFPLKPLNYLYALGVFGSAFAARHWFRRVRVLDFFAAISYPLYLIHSLVGFSTMSFLILVMKVHYEAAAPMAFVVAVCVAWALHISVERLSISAGHRLRSSSSRPRYSTG